MKDRKNGKNYFKRTEGDPAPVVAEIKRHARFSEVDAMGIVWHGRYPIFFEEGSEHLGMLCGLTYKDYFDAGLYAPIVKMHIDYFEPVRLSEEFTIRSLLVWDEAARLNTEYYLIKKDGTVATSGYTVQLFTNARSGEVCLVSPDLLVKCRERWRKGEFYESGNCTI